MCTLNSLNTRQMLLIITKVNIFAKFVVVSVLGHRPLVEDKGLYDFFSLFAFFLDLVMKFEPLYNLVGNSILLVDIVLADGLLSFVRVVFLLVVLKGIEYLYPRHSHEVLPMLFHMVEEKELGLRQHSLVEARIFSLGQHM